MKHIVFNALCLDSFNEGLRSSDPMIQDQYISKTMSLKKFQWFLSNFHLNDNTKMPSREDNSYDKLYKVWPFLKNLNKQFLNCYEPSEV